MEINDKKCLKCLKEACLDKVMEDFYPWILLEDERLVNKIAQNISNSIICHSKEQLKEKVIDNISNKFLKVESDCLKNKIIDRCSLKLLKQLEIKVAVCKK